MGTRKAAGGGWFDEAKTEWDQMPADKRPDFTRHIAARARAVVRSLPVTQRLYDSGTLDDEKLDAVLFDAAKTAVPQTPEFTMQRVSDTELAKSPLRRIVEQQLFNLQTEIQSWR